MALSGSYLGIKTGTLYQLLKYSIYAILLYNVLYFTYEDYAAATHRFPGGVGWQDFYDAFPQAIDSLSWFILLLILELETWVIEDNRRNKKLRWSVNGVAGLCYFFIALAFLGYLDKLMFVLNFTAADYEIACEALGSYTSYMIELDEFAPLTTDTCRGIAAGPYFINDEIRILVPSAIYSDAILLGYTEVINAGTWILVVIVLWVDIFLQQRGKLTDKLYRLSAYLKAMFYITLIIAAIVWGLYGNFMDFWDAFVWIVAFFFIELNLLQWHEEAGSNQHEPIGGMA